MDCVLLCLIEQRATPATELILSAHHPHRLPAVDPGIYAPAVHLIQAGHRGEGATWGAEEEAMRAHPSTPGRMRALQVMQRLAFVIAQRGTILPREDSRADCRFVSGERCSLRYRGYQKWLDFIQKIVSKYLKVRSKGGDSEIGYTLCGAVLCGSFVEAHHSMLYYIEYC